MNPKDMLWVEKYRPQTIEDLIAPARYKKLLLNIVKSGKFPNMLFTGSAGTGKTTASKALCNQMDLEYKLINASKNRGIDYLRTVISEYASNGSWEGKFRVLILDEADKLTIDTQDALRHLIEDNFNTCRFILTGNYPYKFIDALKSRLDHQSFVFDTIDIKEISKPVWVRINEILVAENVTMENPTSVAQFIKDSLPDIRHIIKRMQSLSIQGEGVIPADISRNEMSAQSPMLPCRFIGFVKWTYSHSPAPKSASSKGTATTGKFQSPKPM